MLRALGFPPNLDPNGDYLTLVSSADREIGSDWLEADVDQAHLQRLNEGFSGAGLYLPESGQVVGMLTDAVIDGDRGGYIGRMLPLSAIRRYWHEIDDLLPLPWLEHRACRVELRAAVAAAAVKADLNSVFATAFPMFSRHQDLTTPWEAIRYVAESVLVDHGVRSFLVALAPHLDGAALSRLSDWARRWQPSWASEIVMSRPPVTSIVVMLRTPTRNGKTHVEVAARPLINGLWAGAEEVVMARKDRIREKAEKLISDQVSSSAPSS